MDTSWKLDSGLWNSVKLTSVNRRCNNMVETYTAPDEKGKRWGGGDKLPEIV